ncbi:SDR family NAD(P)-dependent oxidoreductase [Pseudoxanthomonas sp. GM95]|uniref:SDR family NAD(P)-dependent oxidoreductase n=1 Tax=Pseudoxanthomonas sp. GM95 TaxID=1881043 RepID=UPI001587A725|nr:SDR family NAD(P)-dependent oxidoreductase [Pseudoxanthomonas sp. GM95]
MATPKIWFITGAAFGFGRIWAESALQCGDKVIATAANLDDLDDLVARFGEAVLPLQLNGTRQDRVFKVFTEGHRHFGRIDVVLCSTDHTYQGVIDALELRLVRSSLSGSLRCAVSVLQSALPYLKQQGHGQILTLSSISVDARRQNRYLL